MKPSHHANEKFGVIFTYCYPLESLWDIESSGNCPQGSGASAPAFGIRKFGASVFGQLATLGAYAKIVCE
jgi:hypothetical protein